jgi:hypothetical protein
MSLKPLTQGTVQVITKLQDLSFSKTNDKVLQHLNFHPKVLESELFVCPTAYAAIALKTAIKKHVHWNKKCNFS